MRSWKMKGISWLIVAGLVFAACFSSNDDEPHWTPDAVEDTADGVPMVREFQGVGSLGGGLWVFQLDASAMSLGCRRGTDNPVFRSFIQQPKAPYAFYLKITDQYGDSFGWERPDELLIHNFPLGTKDREFYAGISRNLSAGTMEDLSGSYTFVDIGTAGVNDADDVRRWGILGLEAGGTWFTHLFATGSGEDEAVTAKRPDQFTMPFPLSPPGDESGTWSIDAVAGQLVMTGDSGEMRGTFGHWQAGRMLLVDLGAGSGFRAAVQAPLGNLEADIFGSMHFHSTVGQWADGSGWHARWVPPAGMEPRLGLWESPDQYSGQTDITETSRCGSLPNVFRAKIKVGYTGGPDDHLLYWFALGPDISLQLVLSADGAFMGSAIGTSENIKAIY
jgi:hypothetical protein